MESDHRRTSSSACTRSRLPTLIDQATQAQSATLCTPTSPPNVHSNRCTAFQNGNGGPLAFSAASIASLLHIVQYQLVQTSGYHWFRATRAPELLRCSCVNVALATAPTVLVVSRHAAERSVTRAASMRTVDRIQAEHIRDWAVSNETFGSSLNTIGL